MNNFIKLLVICLFIGSSVVGQTKKEEKSIQAAKEFEQMKTLVQSKVFDFRADWATPLQGNRINLITNENFLRMRNDSADIYLPFFGTLQSANSAITGQGGIVFQGIVKDFKSEVDEGKQKISISFTASNRNDVFDFYLTVFHSGNTLVNVNSNYRSAIKYSGMIKEANLEALQQIN